jgi:hypothetical protein
MIVCESHQGADYDADAHAAPGRPVLASELSCDYAGNPPVNVPATHDVDRSGDKDARSRHLVVENRHSVDPGSKDLLQTARPSTSTHGGAGVHTNAWRSAAAAVDSCHTARAAPVSRWSSEDHGARPRTVPESRWSMPAPAPGKEEASDTRKQEPRSGTYAGGIPDYRHGSEDRTHSQNHRSADVAGGREAGTDAEDYVPQGGATARPSEGSRTHREKPSGVMLRYDENGKPDSVSGALDLGAYIDSLTSRPHTAQPRPASIGTGSNWFSSDKIGVGADGGLKRHSTTWTGRTVPASARGFTDHKLEVMTVYVRVCMHVYVYVYKAATRTDIASSPVGSILTRVALETALYIW